MKRDLSGIRIRLAVAEDAPTVASVLRESFAEYEHLYTREGFERTGEDPDNLFGTPLFTMEKILETRD